MEELWADDVLKWTESGKYFPEKPQSFILFYSKKKLRQNSMQKSEGESEILKVKVWKMQSLECQFFSNATFYNFLATVT